MIYIINNYKFFYLVKEIIIIKVKVFYIVYNIIVEIGVI